jgi:hypothetical protein
VGSGSGRRAWYHGAACRQRARRARLAVMPQRAALLDTLTQAEHALAALRRDLLAGGAADPELAAAELTALAARLRTPTATALVTKPVTEPVAEPPVSVAEPAADAGVSARASRRRVAVRPDHAAARPVTEPVTVIESKEPAVAIDPDRVRLTQAADYAQTGVWQVQQHTDDRDRPPVQLGTLIPTRTGGTGGGKRWTARDRAWLTVSGGPWKTRQDALLHLLMCYQNRANSSGHQGR